MHEFDRYVRHKLKPLAYMRYGDDFIIFVHNEHLAKEYRNRAQEFLNIKLGLFLHKSNDIIVNSRDGLHFLGHWIYQDGAVIDDASQERLLKRLNGANAASYQALELPTTLRKQLPWILEQEIDKILDDSKKML
jgi:hypothetical protein